MAFELKLPKLVGSESGREPAEELATPTTQVRAAADAPAYDPLSAPSLMDQMRAAIAETKMPKKVPLVGHLPIVRQFQVLGVLLVAFVVLAVLVMFLDVKTASQATASTATATEMQMLSQRLARGTALASQGQAAAFSAIKDSRDRFKVDLDALQRGGTIKGVSVDVVDDETLFGILKDIKARWDRVDANTERLLENRQNLTDLARGNAAIAQGVNRVVELAQSVGASGGRESDLANQLGALAQRIAKNAAAIVASAEVDQELATATDRERVPRRQQHVLQGRRPDAYSKRAR